MTQEELKALVNQEFKSLVDYKKKEGYKSVGRAPIPQWYLDGCIAARVVLDSYGKKTVYFDKLDDSQSTGDDGTHNYLGVAKDSKLPCGFLDLNTVECLVLKMEQWLIDVIKNRGEEPKIFEFRIIEKNS